MVKAMAGATHPYYFRVAGEESPSPDQSSWFYPSAAEDACWDSFVRNAFEADTAEEDVKYEPIKNRCEHLMLPYPSGNILIKMSLLQMYETYATLLFEHYADNKGEAAPCVRIEKTIACLRRFQARSLPAMWPLPVRERLDCLEIADRGTSVNWRLRLLRRLRSFLLAR